MPRPFTLFTGQWADLPLEEVCRLARDFGIHSLPTVKAFRDGGVAVEFAGLLPEAHLRQFLDQIIQNL